jgi:hypothetical protein
MDQSTPSSSLIRFSEDCRKGSLLCHAERSTTFFSGMYPVGACFSDFYRVLDTLWMTVVDARNRRTLTRLIFGHYEDDKPTVIARAHNGFTPATRGTDADTISE